MQKKLSFALSLTVFIYWTEASPVNLGTLEFDKLDTDLDDLKYEVEEEDLDDYSRILDAADAKNGVENKSKTNAASKGTEAKYNIGDLKKFFKAIGFGDQGAYDDRDVYAAIAALDQEAVGGKGTEERKYKKGTKTKGFHSVHHKDEYKKDKEFYEEDEATGAVKKVGGKVLGFKIGGGAGLNKGRFHHGRQQGIYGKESLLGKGFLDKLYSDYSDDQGLERSFKTDSF